MSKNRHNPVPSYTPREEKKKEEELTVALRICLVCKAPTLSYGAFEEGYVCSRVCNDIQESKPKNTGEVSWKHVTSFGKS